jgi:hypothetical protein
MRWGSTHSIFCSTIKERKPSICWIHTSFFYTWTSSSKSNWNFRFLWQQVWRWLSSGMLHCVIWLKSTSASDVLAISIIRVPYEAGVTILLDELIGSESQAHHFKLETKWTRRDQHHPSSPNPRKCWAAVSGVNVALTVSLDINSIILTHFLQMGCKIEAFKECLPTAYKHASMTHHSNSVHRSSSVDFMHQLMHLFETLQAIFSGIFLIHMRHVQLSKVP